MLSLLIFFFFTYIITMPKPRRSNKPRRRQRKPLASFSKRVLAVVNKQRELKIIRQSYEYPILSSISNVAASVMPILPDIAQSGNVGSTSDAAQEFYRDGNQINLKKVVIRWWISLKPGTDVDLARQLVRHMIVRQRSTAGSEIVQNPSEFEQNWLLEQAQAFTGSIDNYNTPLNKAGFVSRYDRKTYLSSPNINVNNVLAGGDNSNSFKFGQKTITFGKGKTLTYGSGANDYATNFPYFMLMAGITASGLETSGIKFNYTSTAYFHDS